MKLENEIQSPSEYPSPALRARPAGGSALARALRVVGIAALAPGCSALGGLLGPTQPPGALAAGVKMLEASATILVGTGPHGSTFAGGLVVNDNPGSGDVSFIDPATDKEVARVAMPDGNKGKASPSYTAATHDGKYALHLDGGVKDAPAPNTLLRVIDPATRTVLQSVDLGAKPGDSFRWASDAVTLVPVGSATDSNVVAVDFSAGFDKPATVARLTVSRPESTSFTAGHVAVGGGYLAVPNGGDNSVAFVAVGADGKAAGAAVALTYGNGPGAIAISTYGGKATLVYGNKNSNTAVVYDLAGKKLVATLDVGATPTDVALRADGRFAYMTCKGAGEVAVIDVAEGKLVSRLEVGRGLADTPANPVHIYEAPLPAESAMFHTQHDDVAAASRDQIWVCGDGDESATVIDAQENKVVAVVKVGKGHHLMAFSRDGKKAFVSNITDHSVSVVDRTATR